MRLAAAAIFTVVAASPFLLSAQPAPAAIFTAPRAMKISARRDSD